MEQKLMQRHNAGKTDGEDVIIQAKLKKSVHDLTIETIKEADCPFCLEKLAINKGTITIPQCQHCLHGFCFDQLKHSNYHSCLICKQPLEQHDEQLNQQDAGCCINTLEAVSSSLIGSIQYYKLMIILLTKEITDPTVTWKSMNRRAHDACGDCHEDHVTF
jgi:hypothetical protein